MAKFFITACAALFLFCTIAANPVAHNKKQVEDIIDELHKLKTLPENTSTVPKLFIDSEDKKNLPAKEIACRAVQSLSLQGPLKEKFSKVKHLLGVFSQNVNCTVDPNESYDLQTFVNELLSKMQHHFVTL